MADRQINPGNKPEEFTVPAAAGRPDQRPIQLRLTAAAAGQFTVWQKDIPGDVPMTFAGKAITWVNNFGFKRVGSDRFESTVPAYTIELDQGPANAVLVVYDAPNVRALTPDSVGQRVRATLELGDPPVGWAS